MLPPWGTGLLAAATGRVGISLPPEILRQMRFGRGVDNRRFKATGYRYRHTTRETVLRLGEHQRLRPLMRRARTESYRYEHALEEFLRYSPSVRPHARPAGDHPERRNIAARAAGAPLAVDDLDAAEIIALLRSLDAPGLRALHAHEIANRGRRTVISAIERLQRWEAQP